MITVPIHNNFDPDQPIGTVTIDETKIRDMDMILALGFRFVDRDKIDVRSFGLIPVMRHAAIPEGEE